MWIWFYQNNKDVYSLIISMIFHFVFCEYVCISCMYVWICAHVYITVPVHVCGDHRRALGNFLYLFPHYVWFKFSPWTWSWWIFFSARLYSSNLQSSFHLCSLDAGLTGVCLTITCLLLGCLDLNSHPHVC